MLNKKGARIALGLACCVLLGIGMASREIIPVGLPRALFTAVVWALFGFAIAVLAFRTKR